MTAPCKDCPDRDYPHCHMVCEKYLAYKAERQEISQRKAEKAELNAERGRRIEKLQRQWIMKRKREGR